MKYFLFSFFSPIIKNLLFLFLHNLLVFKILNSKFHKLLQLQLNGVYKFVLNSENVLLTLSLLLLACKIYLLK